MTNGNNGAGYTCISGSRDATPKLLLDIMSYFCSALFQLRICTFVVLYSDSRILVSCTILIFSFTLYNLILPITSLNTSFSYVIGKQILLHLLFGAFAFFPLPSTQHGVNTWQKVFLSDAIQLI